MLESTSHKYLDFVRFPELYNWSVQYLNDSKIRFNKKYPLVRIGEFLTRNKTAVTIQDEPVYQRVTIRVRNGGVVPRDEVKGANIGTKKQYVISSGQFILSKIDARNGAMGIIPESLDGAIVTQDFLAYDIDRTRINPQYLVLISTTKQFIDFCQSCSSGTTNRQRVDEAKFLSIRIPLPSLDEQNRLVKDFNNIMTFIKMEEMKVIDIEVKAVVAVREALGVALYPGYTEEQLIRLTNYAAIDSWSVPKILLAGHSPFGESKYKCKKLSELAFINPRTDLSMLNDTDEMSFIPMEDISDDYGEWQNKKIGKKADVKGYTKFQNGDIIWARITPCMQNGKSALLSNLINGKGYGSTEFHIVRINSNEILPQYIHTLLRHFDVLSNAKKYFTGSAGQQRVPASFLSNLLIPIPPLDIQRQIAIEYAKAMDITKQGYIKIHNYKTKIKQDLETQIFE
ncbi:MULTISPECIES: restriction endonuclease subunit S [Bacteroidales]|uniref:restriction endonuclease subunit S n=1 Tax=Bacteroidales TaxID=171549 RepID=UPI002594499F|nr:MULTISPECIES: restriction endonuclease subunit S [Bacteroidales]